MSAQVSDWIGTLSGSSTVYWHHTINLCDLSAPALNACFLIPGIDFLCLESIQQAPQDLRSKVSVAIPGHCCGQKVDVILIH